MGEMEHDWKRVELALASAEWDFRSVDGIAAELWLPPGHVRGSAGTERRQGPYDPLPGSGELSMR